MARNPILGINTPNLHAPTTTLSAAPSSGMCRAVVFPLSGGVQFLDDNGALVTPATTGTSVTSLTVNNTATDSVTTVLTLNHILSSGTAANGIGTAMILRSTVASGSSLAGSALTMTFTDVTAASEDASLTMALCVAGGVTDSIVFSAPSAGTNVLTAAGATDANLALRSAGTGVASLQGSAGTNIVAVSTVTGASRLGFFGAAPAIQGLAIADLGAFTDPPSAAEMATLRTTVNSILARLRTPGFIAT